MPEILDPPAADVVVRRFRVTKDTIQRFEPGDHSIVAGATYSGGCSGDPFCSYHASCQQACVANPPL